MDYSPWPADRLNPDVLWGPVGLMFFLWEMWRNSKTDARALVQKTSRYGDDDDGDDDDDDDEPPTVQIIFYHAKKRTPPAVPADKDTITDLDVQAAQFLTQCRLCIECDNTHHKVSVKGLWSNIKRDIAFVIGLCLALGPMEEDPHVYMGPYLLSKGGTLTKEDKIHIKEKTAVET